jgi:hypothetical protein
MVSVTFTNFNADPLPINLGLDPDPPSYRYGTVVGGGTALNTKDGDASYVQYVKDSGNSRSLITARGVLSGPIAPRERATSTLVSIQVRYTVEPGLSPPTPHCLMYAIGSVPSLGPSSETYIQQLFSAPEYPWTGGTSWSTEDGIYYFYGIGSEDNAAWGQHIIDTILAGAYFVFSAGNPTYSIDDVPIRLSQLRYDITTSIPAKLKVLFP